MYLGSELFLCGGQEQTRSPLLLRRGLQRGDVELHHLHHRGHRIRMLHDLANLLRHDLPAQAELVRQPAAGHGLATLKQLVPVALDLGPGPCTRPSMRKRA
jgi:hypothetical protein